MIEPTREISSQSRTGQGSERSLPYRTILLALGPLALLILVLAVIAVTDAGLGSRDAPPIENLAVQQVRLPEPGLITMRVFNGGPDPISIAQVRVDDAFWQFEMDPIGELERLGSASISIPYPWVKDEAHAITIITSTGAVFESTVPVALESPKANSDSFLRYGLVGLYVGIVPIALGFLWFPFLRRLGRQGMNFILALTVGLLLFLVVDMFDEAREIALTVPSVWNASLLVPILAVLTTALLVIVGRSIRAREGQRGALGLAYQIAVGIGLHNLGEGLAIGAAFALGEAALGVFLIAGFTLHNVTEGVGIAAPLVKKRPPLKHFAALALVAGGPAIVGTWLGAFTYSPLWTAIFLAIGVGAIVQVIFEVGKLIVLSQRRHDEPAMTWTSFAGVTAGVALMYATAIFVAA